MTQTKRTITDAKNGNEETWCKVWDVSYDGDHPNDLWVRAYTWDEIKNSRPSIHKIPRPLNEKP